MRTVLAALALFAFPSCSLLTETLTGSPVVEPAVPTHSSYLQGGPNTSVELGQDERTLLEDYKKLHDAKVALETKLGETNSSTDQLRGQLAAAEQERDRLRNQLTTSQTDGERLVTRARDLESKVLSLEIEKTVMEQELLRLRITSLREQYERLVSAPAAPAGGAQR